MKNDQESCRRTAVFSQLLSLKVTMVLIFIFLFTSPGINILWSQPLKIAEKRNHFGWIQTARVFLIDAYQPPFAPELEYDAKALAETMKDMHVNVVRFGTMGKYATIQGTEFSMHPDQGDRDLLSETIEACKPAGIKVIPYISTGHKLAWSMVTKDYPEYGQKTTPGGIPERSHMYVGEDHGTVCWMTPYREAFLDMVEHVVQDYDIDGIYFDKWEPNYFWKGKKLCYCPGCRKGFREATGLEIPYHEENNDYTRQELETIDRYHEWYKEEYIVNVVEPVRKLVKSYRDIPLIVNINNPETMATLDPRIINAMDAFLYERGKTILERAEGVGVPRSIGLHVWPYIGVYHNWPRLTFSGYNYQQQIFTNLMFGGGAIIAQPTGYINNHEHRKYVCYPFEIIEKNENELKGLQNVPYVGVVFAYETPDQFVKTSWHEGVTNSRTSTRGAFSACLYGHIQVGAISEFVLDKPSLLKTYPVIYLANIPGLSSERIRNIRDYVSQGGCLIASYNTSLSDSSGRGMPHFSMEDLFRARPVVPSGKKGELIRSHTAMIGGPNDLYLKVSEDSEDYFSEKDHDRLFPLWYYQPVEVLQGGKVIMDIVTGTGNRKILPGIIMSDYGEGRVIYCASALESLYDAGGADIVQELILKMVDLATEIPPPFFLGAPASLIGNLTAAGDRMVFHLTNWTGNKYEKPWRNEYYLSPVENVALKIKIPEGKKVQKISTLVKTDFKQEINDQYLELFFPRIGAYQAVVVELE